MKFFKYKAEEKLSLTRARESCTRSGLNMEVSRRTLLVLRDVAGRSGGVLLEDAPAASIYTLERRGLIMQRQDEKWAITELGFLVVAMAEALGLLAPIKVTE